MEIYLVGGAVRDQLLGLPIKERDWVVVGATQQEMLDKGYKKVGRDFPVFLHPKTHEEYALARTERKTGKGYTQFECHADPSVTLEDDLKRRDLTINAIAMTLDGILIDPYGGIKDLKKHILRHVSQAFAEDPVRILRVARFAAKFPDFKVHAKTNQLMQEMLARGEVDALIAERVWQEFSRALEENAPWRFFAVLEKCGALKKLFPEIDAKFRVVQQSLKKSALLSREGAVRFAAMLSGLSEQEIKALCGRYKVPREYKDLSVLVARYADKFKRALNLNAKELVDILEGMDAFRRADRFKKYLQACLASDRDIVLAEKKKQLLLNALERAQSINIEKLIQQGFSLERLRMAIKCERIKAIEKALH